MAYWKLGRIGGGLLVLLFGAVLLALWLRSPASVGEADAGNDEWFADVTEAAGVDFVHDAGAVGRFPMPQIVGSGGALFDADGDGWLDLYLLTNGGPDAAGTNRLYRNRGDGTFEDVTAGSGLGITGHNMGVAVGDVDNDGRPDVLVTQVGGVKLFHNRGNGIFEDITAKAGLRNPQWATSANFVDYDRDGWLDLVVVNYVEYDPAWPCSAPGGEPDYCAPKVFRGTASRLFHNQGASGPDGSGSAAFKDVTVAAGLAKAPGPGLGVYCADFNGDGWPDLFIANDGQPNHLWINQKDGTFREDAYAHGLAVDAMGHAHAGMGIAVGDVDNDERFDVYVTHLGSERNTLWVQGPRRGMFRDGTAAAGLLRSQWRGTGFGTLMADFNNDGWLDLAVVNGRVASGTPTPNAKLGTHFMQYSECNQIFRNNGDGKFCDVARQNQAFCGVPNVARGLLRGDLDGDGGQDLVVTTIANRVQVYRNAARARGHWLLVQAIDPRLHRDAYGAEVTVQAGAQRWLRIVNPGDSFLCSSDPRAHFGLGHRARYDAIDVCWPDGLVERFGGGAADRVVVLQRGDGAALPK